MNKTISKLTPIVTFLISLVPFYKIAAQVDGPNKHNLPPIPIGDIIQVYIEWTALILGGLSLLLIIIFGISYFFKDIEGKKKSKKMLLYSSITFLVSLLTIIIIRIFFTNYI